MTFRLRIALTGFALVAAALFVFSPLPIFGQTAASRVKGKSRTVAEAPPAEAGQIELSKSRVYVHVGKTGLGHVHAIEGRIKSGSIELGAQVDAGTIEFDMKSFTADTDRARKFVGLDGSTGASTQQQVNNNMLGPAVLNVQKYPTATFQIESAVKEQARDGKAVYALKGKFTLHGKTRALTVKAAAANEAGFVHLRGDFSILQSEYGITPYTAALGTIGVADKLRIWGDIWIAEDPR